MRTSRFTESQILAVLKDGEAGMPVAEIITKHGISRNTYFGWKAKYAGATVSELRRRSRRASGNGGAARRLNGSSDSSAATCSLRRLRCPVAR